MKHTFFQLSEQKRAKIVAACIHEFGAHEYEKASLDKIVEKAGISKGGLYEYITSKEELYLYIVDASYGMLYSYLHDNLDSGGLPADVLDRFRVVSDSAIDFYLSHPEMVGIIVNTARLLDEGLSARVEEIYTKHFAGVFATVTAASLRFPLEPVMELLKWILVKTRNDFLKKFATTGDQTLVREEYREEWAFILSVLSEGIYAR